MEKLDVDKGIIYYTDNRIDRAITVMVRRHILEAGLTVVSCSLKPMDFGSNIVVEGEFGYPTMVKQILAALVGSSSKYVFFCEHDVIYDKTHFDFEPSRDDIYYYNSNNWRWDYPKDRVIHYDRLISLSSLCCNRKLAINHFIKREKAMEGIKWTGGEPTWLRKMGYEPGTKKKRRGGLTDEDFETWQSQYPNIDIRHNKTFSPSKVTLDSFKHAPKNWKESTLGELCQS